MASSAGAAPDRRGGRAVFGAHLFDRGLEQDRLGLDDLALGDGDRGVDDALELPEVAGPGVLQQLVGGLAAQAHDGLALGAARGRDGGGHDGAEVVRPLARGAAAAG